jgi:UDP-glucose 4-epimerase
LRSAFALFSEGDPEKRAVVWAAGRAGFAASQDDCDQELEGFEDTLSFVQQIASGGDQRTVYLHVVSSAGGLFEGLLRVSDGSPVTPQRPYGVLKREQEHLAMRLSSSIRVRVYRVSSVYGAPRPGHRVGLIGQLIMDGVAHRQSAIFGGMDTLRDYVGSDEVGRHIASRIMNPVNGADVEMLVAGRPSSVSHVVDVVERALRRRLFVSFEEAWNTRDITFDKALRAPGFLPEDLSVGASRALHEYLTRL